MLMFACTKNAGRVPCILYLVVRCRTYDTSTSTYGTDDELSTTTVAVTTGEKEQVVTRDKSTSTSPTEHRSVHQQPRRIQLLALRLLTRGLEPVIDRYRHPPRSVAEPKRHSFPCVPSTSAVAGTRGRSSGQTCQNSHLEQYRISGATQIHAKKRNKGVRGKQEQGGDAGGRGGVARIALDILV